MANLISEMAAKVGVSPEQIEKGMGAVLSLLKEKLPADTYAKVNSAVPGADGMIAASAVEGGEAGGGLLGSITGAVSKLVGSGGAAGLITKLTQLGFSMDQLQKFAAAAMEFFKNKLPPDAMKKIADLMPGSK